jgi:hypothetical protein
MTLLVLAELPFRVAVTFINRSRLAENVSTKPKDWDEIFPHKRISVLARGLEANRHRRKSALKAQERLELQGMLSGGEQAVRRLKRAQILS